MNKFNLFQSGRGKGGSVTLALLVALALGAMVPALTATSDVSAVAEAGKLEVPKGFPASDKRFTPSNNKSEFRVYYAYSGAETWDGWTGSRTSAQAQKDAEGILSNSEQYTHAFVENRDSKEVTWTSWSEKK